MMQISEIIRHAIAEDLGEGDHTSLATIPKDSQGRASLIIKQAGIIAGLPYAGEVFRQIDPSLELDIRIDDGTPVNPGDVVFQITGSSYGIVTGERLALNILQRLSGIATYTNNLVQMIAGYPAKLLDTRKTTPLLREMEKYAVRIGGGFNHRMGLYDMIMIKDNHVDFAGGISEAIERVKAYLHNSGKQLPIEIEVRNFEELEEALKHGAVNRIMLDNFDPESLKRAVALIDHRFETEASGKITSENIKEYAATGVDYISVGALTHHIKSLDMSLKAN